jgi:glycosyl transferase family 25
VTEKHTVEITKTKDSVLLSDYFTYIAVINLADRPDRRLEIEHQLKKVSLGLTSASVHLYTAVRPTVTKGFPSKGAYGCFMSHLALLKQALANNVDRVLIIEDDLDFINHRLVELPKIWNELISRDWDICYLGNKLDIKHDSDELFVNYHQDVVCAHLYAVQGKLLPQLIDFLETLLSRSPGDTLGGPMHYDGALNTFRAQNPSINTLLLREPIGFQRSSKTDIHPLRFYDRTPIIRTIIGLLRKLKNAWFSLTH